MGPFFGVENSSNGQLATPLKRAPFLTNLLVLAAYPPKSDPKKGPKKGVFLGGSPPGKAYLGQLLAGGPCFRLPPQKGPQKVAQNPQIREVPTCKTCRSGGDRDITGPTHKKERFSGGWFGTRKGPPKSDPKKGSFFEVKKEAKKGSQKRGKKGGPKWGTPPPAPPDPKTGPRIGTPESVRGG